MGLHGWELVIVLVIILLLFGARKLPDLADAMGRSIRNFRRATEEEDRPPAEGGSVQGAARDPES